MKKFHQVKTTFFRMLALLALSACLFSCGSSSSKNTDFFDTHDARVTIKSIVNQEELEMLASGTSESRGGFSDQKGFSIAILGDSNRRASIMREYKNLVENELMKEGVDISSRGLSGNVSKFHFGYSKQGKAGIFRASGVVDEGGYIRIDVFLYEHNK